MSLDLFRLDDGMINKASALFNIESSGSKQYKLHQNYPNPFNPETTISYQVPVGTDIKLTIYNIAGEEVKVLVDDYKTTGHYQVIWDGSNEGGLKVANGIYIYELHTNNFTQIKKMILIK